MKLTVLALFIGFQTAQAFHTHKAVSEDHCSVCQVIHQTPSVGATDAGHLITTLVYQRLFVSSLETFSANALAASASIRAPPAA